MPQKKSHKLKYILAGAVLLLLVIVLWFAFGRSEKPPQTAEVVRKDIVSAVLASGKTKAVDNVDLGFEKSGKVVGAYVEVGEKVAAGDVLIKLDSSELEADLAQAKARLAGENATSGSDAVAISDAYAAGNATLYSVEAVAQNALGAYLDQFFEDPGEDNTNFSPSYQKVDGSEVYFSVKYNDRIAINQKRRAIKELMDNWTSEMAAQPTVEAKLDLAHKNLTEVRALIDLIATVVFQFESSNSDTVSVVAGFKNDVSVARTNIVAAVSDIVAAREKINEAQSAQLVSSGENNGISSQEASKLAIKAEIQSINAQIEKTIMRAPFAGTVTKQDVEKGEIVSAGEVIVSIISQDNLEIESNISEVNIGKITVGNRVEVTFDAFPGESYEGTVTYIDPGETLIDSVVNYKVKVALDSVDSKIKSGLTVNLKIETGRVAAVVAVPMFAISETEIGDIVTLYKNGATEDVKITTGLLGEDGFVEVLSGLTEGDKVVIGE